MYTESYERKGFPIRNFLFKLLLIVLFVVLLCWLLPKFISPKITNYSDSKNSNGVISSSSISNAELSSISSQIFADNLAKMKEAATSYYTESKLPTEVGNSVTMTLKEMLEEKLLMPLVDKNGKECNKEQSYVKISKLDDEYLMKINLSCSEKTDYILVHMGCYNYCSSYICDKQNSTTGYYDSAIRGSKESSIVSFYDNGNGTKNSRSNYYYHGGGSTNTTYVPTAAKGSSSSASYVYYITNIYNTTNNKTTPSSSSTGSTINNIINIIVNDCNKNGTCPKPTPEPTPTPTPTPSTEYLYEYTKTVNPTFTQWSDWSGWSKTSCNTKEINCSTSDPTCLKKLQMYKRREKVGTYPKAYTTSHEVLTELGSYNQKSCSKYNYVIIDNITYATTTTTTTNYTRINTITKTTVSSTGGWTYLGRSSYKNPPRDSAGIHYKWVGADYSYCGDTCTTLPTWYYDSYKYSGGLTKVSSTTTPGNVTSSSSSSSSTSTSTSTDVKVSCGEYVYKTVPVYGYVTKYEKEYRDENLYGDVCYQSTKTRSQITSGKTQTKWSTYNDTSLLNDGWEYTGKKRTK